MLQGLGSCIGKWKRKHPFLSSQSSALCRCVGGPKVILGFNDYPEGLPELRKAVIFMVVVNSSEWTQIKTHKGKRHRGSGIEETRHSRITQTGTYFSQKWLVTTEYCQQGKLTKPWCPGFYWGSVMLPGRPTWHTWVTQFPAPSEATLIQGSPRTPP